MRPPPTSVLESLLGCTVRGVEGVGVSADLGAAAHEGTTGVHRVTGVAFVADGERPFSLIVKTMDPGDRPRLQQQVRRELAVYERPEVVAVTGSFRPARSHGCVREEDGGFSVYLEDLSAQAKHPWSDEDYVFAARALGRFHKAGSERTFPDPDWLGSSAIRGFAHVREITESVALARRTKVVFRESAVQLFCSAWDRADAAFAGLDSLPRVLSHGDCHCLNLFLLRESGEVVAVDWAYTGLEVVGADLSALVTAEFVWRAMSIDRFRALEKQAFDAYQSGLDRDLGAFARRGYAAFLALDAGMRIVFALSRIPDAEREAAADHVARLEALAPYLAEAELI